MTAQLTLAEMVFRTVVLLSFLVQALSLSHGREKNYHVIKADDEDTLILTSVVFRHGDRTPDSTTIYPNDPYINETYFPYGLGQLTTSPTMLEDFKASIREKIGAIQPEMLNNPMYNLEERLQGKQNSFHLGELIHQRYKKFLGPIYSPLYLDSYTSNYPRTQMTLQAVHAALFPPRTEDEIDGGLKWQPIPYTYYSAAEDFLIATYRSCDLLYWLTDDLEKTEEYKEILSQFKPLYEYLTNHTGWNVNNTRLSFFIYNSMKTEEEWGFPLPEWTKPIYPEPLKSAASWFWRLVSSTTQLRKISIGNLLKKIILDSEAKSEGTLKPAERKMFLYSGHDFTVVPLLAALGHFDGVQLPYTTHIIFELHKINNVYGFKVYLQDYSEKEPRLLKVHDCEEFCPISQFKQMFEDHFPGPEWCSV